MSNEIYEKALTDYAIAVEHFKVIPLHEIRRESEIDETYRYKYIPLLLTALEREIGKERMLQWLHDVIMGKPILTDYRYFKSSLIKSGMFEKEFNAFEKKYIKSKAAKENVLDKVR